MKHRIYYLGRVERVVLDTRRKHTTLKGMHEESVRRNEMTHPFLWEGYEDIEQHYPITIEDVLGDVPREFDDQPFYIVKDVETFYREFSYEPIFASKEGFEAFIEANRKSGADVSDYEIELAHTNFDTHTLILYAF